MLNEQLIDRLFEQQGKSLQTVGSSQIHEKISVRDDVAHVSRVHHPVRELVKISCANLLTDGFAGYRSQQADLGEHLKHTPIVQDHSANAAEFFPIIHTLFSNMDRDTT